MDGHDLQVADAPVVELATDAGLPELTALVNWGCDRAEDGPAGRPLVVRMPDGLDGWPGRLHIHEVNRWERAIRRIERLGGLTVAVAEGVCHGPALDLLLATDYRIAGSTLRISLRAADDLPWPGMTLYRLAHQVGTARARRLLLRGDDVPAVAAMDLGLVDEVSDDPHRHHAVLSELEQMSGAEMAIRRRLVLEAMTTSYEDAIGTHLAACDRALRRHLPADRDTA